MESVQKQYPTQQVVRPAPIRKIRSGLNQNEVYDKEFAELRRHLASEAAIRQLEQRKSLSAGVVHRMSFMR